MTVDDRVRIAPITSTAGAIGEAMTTCAALFGRDDELTALADAYRAAAGGAGRVVAVAGPAGIGKTSLVVAACGAFRDAGALVLSGGCPAGAGVAYAPFVAAWRCAPDVTGGFEGLFAGLAALGNVPAELARAWLADRLLDRVRDWTARRPVVLVVEDAHRIDASSLAVLDVLAHAAAALRLLVLVTVRDGASDGDAPDGGAARLTELAAAPHG